MSGLRAYLEDEKNVSRVFWSFIGLAVVLTILRPWLPSGLVRIPEALLLPWRDWIDVAFEFIRGDQESGRFGLIYITRGISSVLEFFLNVVSNILYGKVRWPRLEPIPWSVITAVAAILGYYLGGWRLALLAGGTHASSPRIRMAWACSGPWTPRVKIISISPVRLGPEM